MTVIVSCTQSSQSRCFLGSVSSWLQSWIILAEWSLVVSKHWWRLTSSCKDNPVSLPTAAELNFSKNFARLFIGSSLAGPFSPGQSDMMTFVVGNGGGEMQLLRNRASLRKVGDVVGLCWGSRQTCPWSDSRRVRPLSSSATCVGS